MFSCAFMHHYSIFPYHFTTSYRHSCEGRNPVERLAYKLASLLQNFLSTLTQSLSKGDSHNFMVRQAHHEDSGKTQISQQA